MRARGSAPQRETGTGTVSRPGTSAPAARTEGEHRNHGGGNLTQIGQGDAGPDERSANHVPATSTQPPGERGGCPSSPPDGEAGLDAYIQRLVDAAPPLTAEQRDILALLLRRPRHR